MGMQQSSNHYLYLMRPGTVARHGIKYDFKAPLSRRGVREVLHQVKQFRAVGGIRPDCIFCSTATRSRQTAELLLNLFVGTPILFRDTLYLAPSFRILGVLKETDEIFRRLMVIGHHPGLEQMTAVLTTPEHRRPLAPGECVSIALNTVAWSALKQGDGRIQKIFPISF